MAETHASAKPFPGVFPLMRQLTMKPIFPLLLCASWAAVASAQDPGAVRHFDFTGATQTTESVAVAPGDVYSSERGWGFEPGPDVQRLPGSDVTSRVFSFSVALPEGNYRVTATFGDSQSATTNTVKAEARRLMLEQVVTTPGQMVDRSFTVNIRTPQYPGGTVHLKPRERANETITWDDRLTLEFNGSRPGLRALTIAPATNVVTVYLAGDSTVCDQPREPWNSWGQMLPRFFDDHVAVANYAESGESLKSSLAAHRFDKIFSRLAPGDFLLVQFGHNDMKDHAPDALARYHDNLVRVVAQTRARGATPVLVTSMERKAGLQGPTLAGYPATVRAVAREQGVALIDLNAVSLVFYRALGPNLNRAFQDGTHHNNYGSYELARCVVEGIRAQLPTLAVHLAADVPEFDPAHPDDVNAFHLAESLARDTVKPEGN